MYEVVSVGKLSETQKSKLRNGHPVRIKEGSGNKLCLTQEQIKKLLSAARKGKAVTITLHPEQAEKHGSGIFGDIATKLKKLAVQNKDLINPIIGRVRGAAKSGVSKLANKANEKIDQYITDINGGALFPAGSGLGGALYPAGSGLGGALYPAGYTGTGGALYPAGYTGTGVKKRGRKKKGEGIIGDVLKNVIGMTGLGVGEKVKPKTLKSVLENQKKGSKPKKGEGIGALAKLAAKALAPIAIDAASNFAKDKVSGMGIKKKRGRKRKGGKLEPILYNVGPAKAY